MGKGDTKGRGKEQYVPLPYAMLKSTAWRSLSGAGMKVFFELHCRYHGGNNGKLTLSLNEAVAALGIGKATAQRAFVELQEKGFLALAKPGDWYSRRAHEWRMTHKPVQSVAGKKPATNEWRKYQLPQKPSKKTEHGSDTDPSRSAVVPFENPKTRRGSA